MARVFLVVSALALALARKNSDATDVSLAGGHDYHPFPRGYKNKNPPIPLTEPTEYPPVEKPGLGAKSRALDVDAKHARGKPSIPESKGFKDPKYYHVGPKTWQQTWKHHGPDFDLAHRLQVNIDGCHCSHANCMNKVPKHLSVNAKVKKWKTLCGKQNKLCCGCDKCIKLEAGHSNWKWTPRPPPSPPPVPPPSPPPSSPPPVASECIDWNFDQSTRYACPDGWTCTGSAKTAAHGDYGGTGAGRGGWFFVGDDGGLGSGMTAVFTLPTNVVTMRFYRCGGADNGYGGVYMYKADAGEVADQTLIATCENGQNTDTFFQQTCHVAAGAGHAVQVYTKDFINGGWGKTFIDDIDFLDANGNVVSIPCGGYGNAVAAPTDLACPTQKWAKILAFDDYYTPTIDTFGDLSVGAGKVTDNEVNELRSGSPTYNGRNVYMFKCSKADKYAFLYSSRNYVDTTTSWNLNDGGDKAPNALRTTPCHTGSDHTFSQYWIDYLYGGSGGESCNRYFVGHGTFDCYSVGGGVRCMKGGSSGGQGSCAGGYSMLGFCEMFLLVDE